MTSPEIMTVFEMDLASYGDAARALEEHLDVYAVEALQKQVQGFVDHGLSEVELRREDVVLSTSGDNAIILFDEVEPMHRFAAAVSAVTSEHNRTKSLPSAHRWFRMGCATGEVLVKKSMSRIAGTATARAVRLVSASEMGSLLIDIPTFDLLPAHHQARYGAEVVVTGKRDERFAARRCEFVDTSELSAELSTRPSAPTVLSEVWEILDANLQDAFALAYNKKMRERPERPTRISTRDLFQALARINDDSLVDLLSALPASALPEPSNLLVTNEPLLLDEEHSLSDCVAESLGAFAGTALAGRKVRPTDIFVDISKHGHGPSVESLRKHGIGPTEIETTVSSLGVKVLDPRKP